MTFMDNHEIAWAAAEYIISHPDAYDAHIWVDDTGTVRDFSGWVAYFAGWRPLTRADGTCHPEYMTRDDDPDEAVGMIRHVENVAFDALGMTNKAHLWALSSTENTITDICGVLITWARRDGRAVPMSIMTAYLDGCGAYNDR